MAGPPVWIEMYGPLFSAGAILISATIAVCAIIVQMRIARKRATLDLLTNREWDRDYLAARAEFIKLKDAPHGLEFWATKDHAGSPQAETIKNILNEYELIAVGIENKILDEDFYKSWFRKALISDYIAAIKYIQIIRDRIEIGTPNNEKSIFARFEALAKKWIAEDDRDLQR